MDDLLLLTARNMASMWDAVARASNGRTRHWDDAWAADSSAPNVLANRTTVLAPDVDRVSLAARLDDFYGPALHGIVEVWGTGDYTDVGFEDVVTIPCMAREPSGDGPSRHGVDIRRAATADDIATFKRVLYEGFTFAPWPDLDGPLFGPALLGEPGLDVWIAFVDGAAAACSVSLRRHGVVGVYLVATVPEHRGRGLGEAVSWRATLADPSVPAVLQASSMGLPIYERMGYRTLSSFTFWARNAED